MSLIQARGESSKPSGGLRKQKGWIGYVRSFNEYLDNGNYENIEWAEKTSARKVEVKEDGRTIFTF
jgi:hypothetical protein